LLLHFVGRGTQFFPFIFKGFQGRIRLIGNDLLPGFNSYGRLFKAALASR